MGDKPIIVGEVQRDRQRVARFALWVNDKEGNEKRPDFKGKITSADGKDVSYLSAWIRDRDVGDLRVKIVPADGEGE